MEENEIPSFKLNNWRRVVWGMKFKHRIFFGTILIEELYMKLIFLYRYTYCKRKSLRLYNDGKRKFIKICHILRIFFISFKVFFFFLDQWFLNNFLQMTCLWNIQCINYICNAFTLCIILYVQMSRAFNLNIVIQRLIFGNKKNENIVFLKKKIICIYI